MAKLPASTKDSLREVFRGHLGGEPAGACLTASRSDISVSRGGDHSYWSSPTKLRGGTRTRTTFPSCRRRRASRRSQSNLPALSGSVSNRSGGSVTPFLHKDGVQDQDHPRRITRRSLVAGAPLGEQRPSGASPVTGSRESAQAVEGGRRWPLPAGRGSSGRQQEMP